MLKIITQLSMFLVGTLAQAQVSQTREVPHFSKVVSKDGIGIVLTQSDKTGLVAQATDALSLNGLITEVKDNTLYVYAKDDLENAKVYVSTSELTSLEISGRSIATLTKEFNMPELSIAVSGKSIFTGNVNAAKLQISLASGSVYNGSLTAQDFSATLGGNSVARLSGWAANSRISADARSKCHAKTLYSNKAELDAQNRSLISANVEQKVKAEVSDESEIRWSGFPDSVKLSEGAQIKTSNTTALTGI